MTGTPINAAGALVYASRPDVTVQRIDVVNTSADTEAAVSVYLRFGGGRLLLFRSLTVFPGGCEEIDGPLTLASGDEIVVAGPDTVNCFVVF